MHQDTVEKKGSAEFRENRFHNVVLAGGDAAREQQQVRFEATADLLARVVCGVARVVEDYRNRSGANHLRGKRNRIGIADLVVQRSVAYRYKLVSSGDNRYADLPIDAHTRLPDGRQPSDNGMIDAGTDRDGWLASFGFASGEADVGAIGNRLV